jgi:SAM-dependent methyltransferase
MINSCPLCQKTSTKLLKVELKKDLVNLWQQKQSIDVDKILLEEELFYFSCHNCDYHFYRTTLDKTLLSDLYLSLGKEDWYYCHRIEFDLIPKLIKMKDVLDFGSGNESFKKSLGEAHYYCFDPNTHDVEIPQRPFDTVTALQVLEHVENPHDIISQLIQKIVPGGYLVLSVPNRKSFMDRIRRNNPIDLPPHHLSHWSLKTLNTIPQIFEDLKIVKIIACPLEEIHIDLYRNSYRDFLPRKIIKALSPLLTGHTLLGIYQRSRR